MLTVGVRDLKSRLSQYIELVQSGEDVLITDHNVIVAELRRPGVQIEAPAVEKIMKKLQSMGKIVRAKRKSTQLPPLPGGAKKRVKHSDWWKTYQDAKEDRL